MSIHSKWSRQHEKDLTTHLSDELQQKWSRLLGTTHSSNVLQQIQDRDEMTGAPSQPEEA